MKRFHSDEPGFDSPEEAALAGWPAAAMARVVRVEAKGLDEVDVIVDTEPHYLMRVRCARLDGLWFEEASGNDVDDPDWPIGDGTPLIYKELLSWPLSSPGKYRRRTYLRMHFPSFMSWMFPKGRHDCGNHDWYNVDGTTEACYHCEVGSRPYDPRHFD